MRIENWTTRLDNVLADAEARHFAWGKHDCCLFADAAHEAVTGTRLVPEAIEAYTDEKSAYRYLKKRFKTIEGMAAQLLGDSCDPAFAGRGDIAMVQSGERFAVGVIDLTGENIAFVDAEGMARLPRSVGLKFWKI